MDHFASAIVHAGVLPVPFHVDNDRAWPVVPEPLPGELADSWTIRLFWQMGIDPTYWRLAHRMPGQRLPWQHVLSRFQPEQSRSLQLHTGLSPAELSVMSVDEAAPRPERGERPPSLVETPHAMMISAPSVLGLDRGNTSYLTGFGTYAHSAPRSRRLNFCPHCLAEDKVAYLRRHWRLAFSTACPRHGTILADRCARCDAPCRPWLLSLRKVLLRGAQPSVAACWRCDFDLCDTPVQDACSETARLEQRFWLAWNSALIARGNLRYVSLLPGFDRVLMDSTFGKHRGDRFTGERFQDLTPVQRHDVVAGGARLFAGFAELALGSYWERSEELAERPLIPKRAPPVRKIKVKRTSAKAEQAAPFVRPESNVAKPSAELVDIVSREMATTGYRLATTRGQRAFLGKLMRKIAASGHMGSTPKWPGGPPRLAWRAH